jgi:CRP/FNR family transcriptional regulator, cyclic AMP receptor protein
VRVKVTTVQTLEDLLAGVPLFDGVDAAAIEMIAGCGRNVAVAEGEHLFRAGETADQFYVVRHGSVALDLFVPARGPLVIETIEATDVVGWSWLFPPYRWHFDARAVEPVRATAFDGVCLRGKLDANPALGYDLMSRFAQVMIARLQATRVRLLDVYGDGSR